MEKLGANIYVETVYPGVNVGCVITNEGAICIDTPLLPGEAQRWRARIRTLGAENICFVVYTNGQSERVLGTQYLLDDEPTLRKREPPSTDQPTTVRQSRPPLRLLSSQPPIIAAPGLHTTTRKGAVVAHRAAWKQAQEHSSDSFRQSMVDMLGDRDPDMANLKVILPQITFDEQITLYTGNVTATLLAAGKGILWVWFAEQQVLFVGDSVVVGVHPALNIMDVREWLDALNQLREESQFGDAVLVPGRGPMCDASATKPLTEYLSTALNATEKVFRAGRPKADLNDVAAELVPLFPVPDGQRERVQRQIKLGLDDLYDELKAADAVQS